MKTRAFRKWELLQRKHNRKHNMCTVRKSAHQQRNTFINGKYIFLLSDKNWCVLLRFVSKESCITEQLFKLNNSFSKLISKRYLISRKRNKKYLRKFEVKVTKNFQSKFSVNNNDKRVSPIKILSCAHCKDKFTTISSLDEHILNEHSNISVSANSSRGGSVSSSLDDETVGGDSSIDTEMDENDSDISYKRHSIRSSIDNEEEEENHSNSSINAYEPSEQPNPSELLNIPKEPSKKTEEQSTKISFKRNNPSSEHLCAICSTLFKQRALLDRHIQSLHLGRAFQCYRCKVSYDRHNILLNHLRSAHAKFNKEEGFLLSVNNPDSSSIYHCCFCKFTSKSRLRAVTHLMEEHYEEFEKKETSNDDGLLSSPDSLEELLLPETRKFINKTATYEDLLVELPDQEFQSVRRMRINTRKPPNDPSFRYRCIRCLKRFSRSHWLKYHLCSRNNEEAEEEMDEGEPSKKRRITVNGFFQCSKNKCSQVFTDRSKYNEHLKSHS